MKTLLGRDLRGHDEDEELDERCNVGIVHGFDVGGRYLTERWNRDLAKALTAMVEDAIGRAPAQDQDPLKWSQTRGLWMPGGTSSHKERLQNNDVTKAAAEKGWSYSKKAAWADVELSLHQLLSLEPKMVVRSATKNEPGLKRRALRASDDESYLIAAYASAALEKTFSVGGAVMRQRPYDVKEAASAVYYNRRGYNICIDYSNFNTTHQVTSRVLLNEIIARQYAAKGQELNAQAASWIAKAHYNHWASGRLVNRGLSSGERDTARDNTILHVAYAKLAQQALEVVAPSLRRSMQRFCGDDEIIIGCDWYDAVQYVDELERQGHHIQQKKIMLSKDHGEFLQYNMSAAHPMPAQPLAPALINAISGSWYKNSRYDIDAIPQQSADTVGGLVRRGLTIETGQKLAISCCSWLCKGRDWKTRLRATGLFGAVVAEAPPSSTNVTVEDMRNKFPVPTKCSKDYVTWLHATYPKLAEHISTADISSFIDLDIFGSAVAVLRKEQNVEEHIDDNRLQTGWLAQPRDKDSIALDWLRAAEGERTDQAELLAFSAGIKASWLRGPHAKAVVNALPNRLLGQVNVKDPPPLQLLQQEKILLPGALVSYVC
jgi:hypothetical protein